MLDYSKEIIIAIDGYSSCGKSTLAKALARELKYKYIDSGAMYRAVALFLHCKNIGIEDLQRMNEQELRSILDNISISFELNAVTGNSEIQLNGLTVEKEIREMKISEIVSSISTIKSIRVKMVELQKSYGVKKGIVMDGRDIGTTVFPDAELKLFMIANKEVRAKRRFDELKSKGYEVTMEEVFNNIESRDSQDENRAESPLRKAADAIIMDNSDLNEKEQFAIALEYVKNCREQE